MSGGLKVCVLQPDYSASGVDYRHYDPQRDLAPLLPGCTVHHEALNKVSTYRQLKRLAAQGFDIFVNLCEGYPEWDVPGIDVMQSLEALGLPYTGPTPTLYDVPKPIMKYVAHIMGVATPLHALLDAARLPGDLVAARQAIGAATQRLRFPCFVKPAGAGDSLGVDDQAVVADLEALTAQVRKLADEFPALLVEEYIDGREFTVLVVGDAERPGRGTALVPVEYTFPPGFRYKSYALKTSELHPEANHPVRDEALASRLRQAAERVFEGFAGVGYARMDFRMDAAGTIHFLELNFTCSVFYEGAYGWSADHILRFDPMGQAGFLERIIAEGRARHRRREKAYALRGDAIAGYGVVATKRLTAGELIWAGEGRPHRIVTRRHVERHWDATDRELFRHYAVPLSDEVYAIWDEDPLTWAPWNHSCAANTGFRGLDVVALRDIAVGEELTLDYGHLLDERSAGFDCRCGAPGCRGRVTGRAGNSVTDRERAAGA